MSFLAVGNRSKSTIHGVATYIGPVSRGFIPGRRYIIKVRGERLEALDYELGGSSLFNLYTLGGFLANWSDIQIRSVSTGNKTVTRL